VTLTRSPGYNPRIVVRASDDNVSASGSADFVDEAMLADALAKARKLVAEIEKQQAELDAAPPRTDLSPQQLATGKFAMEKALASARRMLKALEDAQRIAHQSQAEESDPHDPN
jgi:hypothetical protein